MILSAQQLLEFQLEMEELKTRRDGMISENIMRQHCKEALTYSNMDFFVIANQFQCLREQLIALGER